MKLSGVILAILTSVLLTHFTYAVEWSSCLRPRAAEERDGVTVLLVEDEIIAQSRIEIKLKKAGYIVTTVGAVEEALAKLGSGSFDAVITDIGLPVLKYGPVIRESGYRVIKGSKDKGVPVIAIPGGLPDKRNISDLMSYGAADVIPKLDGYDKLASVIQRIVSARGNENAGASSASAASPFSPQPQQSREALTAI